MKKGKKQASGGPGSSVKEYRIERKGEDALVVRVGDTVLLRPPTEDVLEYVARVETIQLERNDVKVKTRWYYRPEESLGGRRSFHGEKELFLSDHYDTCSADAVIGLCTVHTFKNYVKLDSVEPEDFFCRFEYRASTGTFKPDYVAVYCTCEMPYNPDDLMVQCDSCKDWFHPKCINLSVEAAKELNGYTCESCKKGGGKVEKEVDPDEVDTEGDGEIVEDKEHGGESAAEVISSQAESSSTWPSKKGRDGNASLVGSKRAKR